MVRVLKIAGFLAEFGDDGMRVHIPYCTLLAHIRHIVSSTTQSATAEPANKLSPAWGYTFLVVIADDYSKCTALARGAGGFEFGVHLAS